MYAYDHTPETMYSRLIAQAQKDTTTVVAEREVEKMTYEALSADDLQCPDVLATVQQVASVAGHVIADNVKTHEQVLDKYFVVLHQVTYRLHYLTSLPVIPIL